MSPEAENLRDATVKDMTGGATPFDKFLQQQKLIDEIRRQGQDPKAGIGGLAGAALGGGQNAGIADQAMFAAFLDLEKSLSTAAMELPKAMEIGSSEAASTISRTLFQQDKGTMQERLLDVTTRAKEEAAEYHRNFKAFSEAFQKQNGAVGF